MSRLGISTCKEIVKIGWHKFQERERREKKRPRRRSKTLIMTPPTPLKKMLIKRIQRYQRRLLTVTEVSHTLHLKKNCLPCMAH